MFTLVAIATLLAADVPASTAFTLTENGVSPYVIVVAQDAIESERTAAKELQEHLEAVTGAKMPIASEAAPDVPKIILGPCEAFRTAWPSLDLASLGQDGIVIKNQGNTLYLAGGRPRGTLYAVYTFLEDTIGCRWWTATERFTPSAPTLTIPTLDTVYTPKLKCREAFYRGAFDGVYAARSKCNGHFERISPEYGGHYRILGWCHTFYQILPPDKYFAEHPDWYSLIDGKRSSENAQLCLTNPEMKAEFIKNALEWIRRDPEAGIISISQNDCGGACQCEACRAIEAEEESASGPIIRFVNAVAEDIEKEFPNFWIETLAYSYTRKPPKLIRPRANVLIRLCSIECSFSQPLADGPQNQTFRDDIEGWSAIAPQLYIWDYVTNFAQYLLPHPNLRVLASNIRCFVDHKAIGLFEQGDSSTTCGDFVELRAWLFAHLMWDPSRDPNALIDEFLAGYYGPAAPSIRAYIDAMHDAAERSGVYLRCYMPDTSSWMNLDDYQRAIQCFDQAQTAAASDPVLAARVRRARLPLDYALLLRYHALRRLAKGQGKPFPGPADLQAFCEDFIKTAESFDVNSYAEGRPFAELAPRLRSRCRPKASIPENCATLNPDDWVDIQDNEFSLASPGTLAFDAEDPAASDGHAARMPANHGQWAVQYPVSADLTALGPVHCYLYLRCEAKTAQGGACTIGIYDSDKKAGILTQPVSIESLADGKYHAIDLGVHTLEPSMYFWAAPINNPGDVDNVFVDRLICIREK